MTNRVLQVCEAEVGNFFLSEIRIQGFEQASEEWELNRKITRFDSVLRVVQELPEERCERREDRRRAAGPPGAFSSSGESTGNSSAIEDVPRPFGVSVDIIADNFERPAGGDESGPAGGDERDKTVAASGRGYR
jgi:hypothetical protein